MVRKSGNARLNWSASSSLQPELTNAIFPPSPSLLWITSYYLLQGKLQWNVFSSSSPEVLPVLQALIIPEESYLYMHTSLLSTQLSLQNRSVRAVLLLPKPHHLSYTLCATSENMAALSPRYCWSCLLMTYSRIHAASSAGTGLYSWTAHLSSGCDTAREAYYWRQSFGTSQCSLCLNHWGTNMLYSESAPIPPAPYKDV